MEPPISWSPARSSSLCPRTDPARHTGAREGTPRRPTDRLAVRVAHRLDARAYGRPPESEWEVTVRRVTGPILAAVVTATALAGAGLPAAPASPTPSQGLERLATGPSSPRALRAGGAAAAAREPAARFRARRRARAGARPDPPREDGPPAGRAQAAAAAVLPAAGRAALPGPRRPGPGRALGHADERAGRGRARDPAAHRQGDDGPAGHQRRRRLHLGPGHRPGAPRRPSGQHLVRGAGLPGRRAPAVHRGHALVQRRPELLRAQPALHLRSPPPRRGPARSTCGTGAGTRPA